MSFKQQRVLLKAPTEWGALPTGIGCTNGTLEALERRGLIETRINPAERHIWSGGWEWRAAPKN